jgi:hypothetical protein
MQHKHDFYSTRSANITSIIILRILSDSWWNQLHVGTNYNIVARILSDNSLPKRGCKVPSEYTFWSEYIMSGFRHEFQSLILFRNLTTYTPNVDGLKACENAYILVGFIFRLVENSPRKSKHTHLKLSKYISLVHIKSLSSRRHIADVCDCLPIIRRRIVHNKIAKFITGLRIMAAINQREFLLWKLLFLLLECWCAKKICRTNMKKEGKDVSEDSGWDLC